MRSFKNGPQLDVFLNLLGVSNLPEITTKPTPVPGINATVQKRGGRFIFKGRNLPKIDFTAYAGVLDTVQLFPKLRL